MQEASPAAPPARKKAEKLKRDFYAREAVTVARELLGMHLVCMVTTGSGRTKKVGRIVETEAYQGPEDLAAHSARGRRTARTETMFGPAGHVYVYLIYGMHHCFNVVTASREIPHAVLVRALEPVRGIEERTQGPGLLCRALGLTRKDNGHDLTGARIWIERPATTRPVVVQTAPRIGVDYSGPWAQKPWRFLDRSSAYLSRPAPGSGKRSAVDRKP